VLAEWHNWRYITAATAANCMTQEERDALGRDPNWRWDNDRQFWINLAQGADGLVTEAKSPNADSPSRQNGDLGESI
jgi:hypothetical protein